MAKQDKYTKSARGQMCLVRLPGCNFNPETTVFAHLNGAGMALKHLSIHGAYACSNCHAILDGAKTDLSREYILIAHYEGMVRTQQKMVKEGILNL